MALNFNTPIGMPQAPVAVASTASTNPNGQLKYQSNVNWAGVDPRSHIFDSNLEAQKMNSFPLSLGSIGFSCGGPIRRGITAMFTGVNSAQLQAYAVRSSLMEIPGMTPDWARVLQQAYSNHTNGQMPLKSGTVGSRVDGPAAWLAQYGTPGTNYDFTLRGPLAMELNVNAMNYSMTTGYRPDAPTASTLTMLGQAAMMKLGPQAYQQPVAYR